MSLTFEGFLKEAARTGTKVDLHMHSGHQFTGVVVTELLRDTAEVQATVDKRLRRWVLDMARIEWAGVS